MNQKILLFILLIIIMTFFPIIDLHSGEIRTLKEHSDEFWLGKKYNKLSFQYKSNYEGDILDLNASVSAKIMGNSAISYDSLAIRSGQLNATPEKLSKGKLYFSIPLAAALGFGGLVGGMLFGYGVLDCSDEGSYCAHGPDNCELWLTGGVGLILGSSLGAYLGGIRKDSKGSFIVTLVGAAIGYLPLLIDQIIPGGPGGSNDPSIISVFGVVGAPLGAAIANNMIRIRRQKEIRTAIFPFAGNNEVGFRIFVSF